MAYRKDSYRGKGGTGYGVRLLFDFFDIEDVKIEEYENREDYLTQEEDDDQDEDDDMDQEDDLDEDDDLEDQTEDNTQDATAETTTGYSEAGTTQSI